MKPTIMIDVSGVDWRLLREQKSFLASEVASDISLHVAAYGEYTGRKFETYNLE